MNEKVKVEREKIRQEEALRHEERGRIEKRKEILRERKSEDLYKPKDKWKTGKTLLELQKQFPMDTIVTKMVKEEFKNNKVLRYPEEYEVYDEYDEVNRKLNDAKMKKTFDKIAHPLLGK